MLPLYLFCLVLFVENMNPFSVSGTCICFELCFLSVALLLLTLLCTAGGGLAAVIYIDVVQVG